MKKERPEYKPSFDELFDGLISHVGPFIVVLALWIGVLVEMFGFVIPAIISDGRQDLWIALVLWIIYLPPMVILMVLAWRRMVKAFGVWRSWQEPCTKPNGC